ncbi:MAG TPA: hypothetical protein VFZ20_22720 [Longimicrobium sp.]|nr:hypothetical protein [Longimicrobium sp.]
MDAARTAAGERRAFSRRIDCAEAGRARQPVNPSAGGMDRREPMQGRDGRRRLDID